MKNPTMKIEITLTCSGNKSEMTAKTTSENMDNSSLRTKAFFFLFKQAIANKELLEKQLKNAEKASAAVTMMEVLADEEECNCTECLNEKQNSPISAIEVVIH
ncbi:hypothetical protein ACLMPP_12465 [Yersinia enterocolitica]|uniref:hypothetical protein n=1 Tax=Yersinia enterocolitica TaxID=630 RepID=UPI00398CA4B3